MPGGMVFRAGGVVVLLGTLTLVLPLVLTAPTELPRRHDDAVRLLGEAERLAFLRYNWLDAAPLFAAAEAQFATQGDERNALLARIGRLRGEVEFGSVPERSRQLGEILRSPLVKQDQRLRLLCLAAKGDIDFQIDPRSAREVWSEVKSLARELNNEQWENRASAELGKIAFYEGRPLDAMRLVWTSTLRAESQNDTPAFVRNITALGEGFGEYGYYEDALNFFDRALERSQATPGMSAPFTAELGRGRMLIALGRKEEGRQILDDALESARRSRMRVREARALLALGEAALQEGDSVTAGERFRSAADLASDEHLYRLLATASSNLARILVADTAETAAAVVYAQEGLAAGERSRDFYHLPRFLTVLARSQARIGLQAEADATFARAAEVVDRLMKNAVTMEQRTNLMEKLSEVFVAQLRLIPRGRSGAKRAFGLIEKIRGRGVRELARTIAGPRRLTARWNPEGTELVELIHRRLRCEPAPEYRLALLSTLWEAEKRAHSAEYWSEAEAFSSPGMVTLDAFQESLRRDEVVLQYVVDQPKSHVLVITRESAWLEFAPGRSAIEGGVEAFLTEVRAQKSARGPASRLYTMLLAPFAELPAHRRLIVIAGGKLQLLPFEALVDHGGRRVVESWAVTYSPSASIVHALRTKPRAETALPFLGVGGVAYPGQPSEAVARSWDRLFGPEGSPDLEALANSADEVRDAAAVMGPGSVVLLGAKATERSVKSQPLHDFEVVHFATHGAMSEKFPERSALVLGDGPESSEDGLLQAREIGR